MAVRPPAVDTFLSGHRFAVAGVSRQPSQPANAIFRKLKASGYDVVPVNPSATELEGVPCYPDVSSVPGTLDGVVVATHPGVAAAVARQAADRGVRAVWFHRSFGDGSVSDEAVEACHSRGITTIVGGCPLMFCEPVDVFHRCFRWWLGVRGRITE